jgi:hypothetical protein
MVVDRLPSAPNVLSAGLHLCDALQDCTNYYSIFIETLSVSCYRNLATTSLIWRIELITYQTGREVLVLRHEL